MRRFASLCLLVLFLGGVSLAQEKVRVFITDSKSWETSGGFGASGGARPQTAEVTKTFGEKCPDLTVTMKQERADYVVLLDHEGGKGFARKDNKVAVFDKEGDSIHSSSTRTVGGAVENACEAIKKDMQQRK